MQQFCSILQNPRVFCKGHLCASWAHNGNLRLFFHTALLNVVGFAAAGQCAPENHLERMEPDFSGGRKAFCFCSVHETLEQPRVGIQSLLPNFIYTDAVTIQQTQRL